MEVKMPGQVEKLTDHIKATLMGEAGAYYIHIRKLEKGKATEDSAIVCSTKQAAWTAYFKKILVEELGWTEE